MASPFRALLAQDMNTWWKRCSRPQRLGLFTVGLIAAVLIPLSLNAVRSPTSTASQAFDSTYVSHPITENGGLTPPTLPAQTLTCNTGKPCSATIQGFDADANDILSLTLDFLPAGLQISHCATVNTFTGRTRITCSLEGAPAKPGIFMLSGTLTDDANNHTTQTLELNVR